MHVLLNLISSFLHYTSKLKPNATNNGKRVVAIANNKGSGEPAHARSLARTYVIRSRKRYANGKLQPEKWTYGLA